METPHLFVERIDENFGLQAGSLPRRQRGLSLYQKTFQRILSEKYSSSLPQAAPIREFDSSARNSGCCQL
jgi:hypothetical protein